MYYQVDPVARLLATSRDSLSTILAVQLSTCVAAMDMGDNTGMPVVSVGMRQATSGTVSFHDRWHRDVLPSSPVSLRDGARRGGNGYGWAGGQAAVPAFLASARDERGMNN